MIGKIIMGASIFSFFLLIMIWFSLTKKDDDRPTMMSRSYPAPPDSEKRPLGATVKQPKVR